MPENAPISLYELNYKLRQALLKSFPASVWIVAEISQINENRSGHCYLELVDKDPDTDTIRAISRATIWSSRYSMIKPYFETTTGQSLASGIKVMVLVKLDYHERYGISLNITDIEPSFTLGDLARKRLEIIKKLEGAGVLNMNRELVLTIVPQKIAVISSDTAAGYGDFIDQLINNATGYAYDVKLFNATMQGSETSASIIRALDDIAREIDSFDVVVIIRGGGAKTDLASFDDFDLAYYITQFPLPVIAGIGHDRDETVIDIVANTSCKTPTAVAEFIIQQADNFLGELDEMKNQIVELARENLSDQREKLATQLHTMKTAGEILIRNEVSVLREAALRASVATGRFVSGKQNRLEGLKHKMSNNSIRLLQVKSQSILERKNETRRLVTEMLRNEKIRINRSEREAELIHPLRVLSRGYSITFSKGKAIKDPDELESGQKIITRLAKGKIQSHVDKNNKSG